MLDEKKIKEELDYYTDQYLNYEGNDESLHEYFRGRMEALEEVLELDMVRLEIELDENSIEKLRTYAKNNNITINRAVINILEETIKENETSNNKKSK